MDIFMAKLVKLVKKTQSNLAENSVKSGKRWYEVV